MPLLAAVLKQRTGRRMDLVVRAAGHSGRADQQSVAGVRSSAGAQPRNADRPAASAGGHGADGGESDQDVGRHRCGSNQRRRLLGQHTREVLADAGLTERRDAIGCGRIRHRFKATGKKSLCRLSGAGGGGRRTRDALLVLLVAIFDGDHDESPGRSWAQCETSNCQFSSTLRLAARSSSRWPLECSRSAPVRVTVRVEGYIDAAPCLLARAAARAPGSRCRSGPRAGSQERRSAEVTGIAVVAAGMASVASGEK